MPGGMEKVQRMIARSLIVLSFCLGLSTDSAAHQKIYESAGVYEVTTDRWRKALNGTGIDATSWVWKVKKDSKHNNGSRDSILIVPNAAYPDDMTLIVWFHGCSGFSDKTFAKRILPQVKDAALGSNSFAVAIPEMPWSINTSTTCGRQGRVWRTPGELKFYVEDVKKKLEKWAEKTHKLPLGKLRIVFVGHSAGGSAIMSASKEGSLCSLSPESIIWSDASYGKWLEAAWRSCIKKLEDTDLHVIVRKWDKPHKNASHLFKKVNLEKAKPTIKYRVLDRKKYRHGEIGDDIFGLANIFPPGC